jgi:hypothetical protein
MTDTSGQQNSEPIAVHLRNARPRVVIDAHSSNRPRSDALQLLMLVAIGVALGLITVFMVRQ